MNDDLSIGNIIINWDNGHQPEVHHSKARETVIIPTGADVVRIETSHGSVEINEKGEIRVYKKHGAPSVQPVAGNALKVRL